MKFLKKLFRRFKKTPFKYLRKLASNEFKQFECEQILGDRKVVRDFGRFYEENEEDMRFLSFVFQHKLEDSAQSFIQFFQQCLAEGEDYRRETNKKLYEEKMEEYNQARKDRDKEKQNKLRLEIKAILNR